MIDKDREVMFSPNGDRGLPESLGALDDFNPIEDRAAPQPTSLVSLGFIRGALRRTVKFWCALGVVGMVIGLGLHIVLPPSYKATTSVLLTYGPNENPTGAVQDNQGIAESRTVAEMAMAKLGVHQTVASFVAATTVQVVTERILQITVSAKTSDQAVSRASAVATSFLALRSSQLLTDQKLLLQSLQNQVNQTQATVNSLNAKISQASAEPASAEQETNLKDLRAQLTQAQSQLNTDQQALQGTRVDTGTLSAVSGSVILDPAQPVKQSKIRGLATYAVTGLILGLGLGAGLVVVQTILSDRLRRRDDVSSALGVPVKLSVGPVPLGRWRRGPRGLAAAERPAVRRVTAHLNAAVPPARNGVASLAVIPIDESQVAAIALLSVAAARAREGASVVVADLGAGTPVAALVGAKGPGVREVTVGDVRLTLAVPGRDDLAPAGPLARGSANAQPSEFAAAVTEAMSSAGLLLTLVTLDPSVGAEHVPGWATSAVTVVTAGRSSWAKLHAAGEMTRLAGLVVTSAVLVGADRTDESLGVSEPPWSRTSLADLG